MKILTTNFLTCAVKACKTSPASYPLHFRDATLERAELDFNPLFVRNILPRLNWDALKTTASELGLAALVPEQNPTDVEEATAPVADEMLVEDEDEGKRHDLNEETEPVVSVSEDVLKKLHELLLETTVQEGKLVCGHCGFEYPIKEGVGNFLLPAHLV